MSRVRCDIYRCDFARYSSDWGHLWKALVYCKTTGHSAKVLLTTHYDNMDVYRSSLHVIEELIEGYFSLNGFLNFNFKEFSDHFKTGPVYITAEGKTTIYEL